MKPIVIERKAAGIQMGNRIGFDRMGGAETGITALNPAPASDLFWRSPVPDPTLFDLAPLVKAELRVIPGWPENFASSDGIIYSKRRGVLTPLKPSECGGADGDYYYVTLCHEGQQRRIGVHQAVALVFLPPPESFEGKLQTLVRHRDNNPHNNRPENLLWGTQKQNLADRIEHGTHSRGERNVGAKITAEIVAEIRRRRTEGETCRWIGSDFGLSYQEVHRIARGLRWPHVAAPVAPRVRRKRKDSNASSEQTDG